MAIVEECLRRESGSSPQEMPIVLLWGARGGGTSKQLVDLYNRFQDGRPHAFHTAADFEGVTPLPRAVALRIAISLGNRVAGYGRLRFPRLLLGLLALQGPTNPMTSTADHTAWLRATLESRRGSGEWVKAGASAIARLLGVGNDLADLLGMAVGGALNTARTVAVLRGRALSWYCEGTGASFSDPVDALAELARQAELTRRRARSTADAGDGVDVTLCRAFLADVREEYDRASRLWVPEGNALVVLDGVDAKPLHDFVGVLAGLVAAGEVSPLLVVAGSTTRAPAYPHYDPSPGRWPTRTAEHATYEDWRMHRALPGWRAFYPLETTRPVPGDDFAAGANVVDRLTRGHAGSQALVRDVMTRYGLAARDPNARELLELDARPEETTLGAALLAPVVEGRSVNDASILARAATTPDLGETAIGRLSRFDQRESPTTARVLRSFHDQDLWVLGPEAPLGPANPDPGDAPPRMIHPLARRVLLHRLAADPDRWDRTHKRLQALALADEDHDAVLYHRLARGDVHAVAAELTTRFLNTRTQTQIRDWYRLLIAVTSAPLREPSAQDDAESHCYQLADHIDTDPTVSRTLVAALQVHADPLGDPAHRLCGRVSSLLQGLAASARQGQFYLTDRAAEFAACPVMPTTTSQDET